MKRLDCVRVQPREPIVPVMQTVNRDYSVLEDSVRLSKGLGRCVPLTLTVPITSDVIGLPGTLERVYSTFQYNLGGMYLTVTQTLRVSCVTQAAVYSKALVGLVSA